MKISVLMSTFNGEEYIEAQLSSLLNQTRKIDELVIIDDCSLDNTVEKVNSFIEANSLNDFWIVKSNKKNKGWRANFIEGIQKTSGDILFFCDQDDIWFYNKVETVERVLISNAHIQVVASNETLWSGEQSEGRHVISENFDILELDDLGTNYFIRCSGCTMAAKREYIDKVLKYHRRGWAHDDFFWKMGILDGTFALLKDSTILHRIHGNNESRKKRTLQTSIIGVNTDIMVAEQLLKYLDDTAEIRPQETLIDKRKVLEHKKTAGLLHLEYFKTKKLWLLIKLGIKYSDIYRRKRQVVGDFLLVHGLRS